MVGSIRELITGMLILGLFVFSMVSFGVMFSLENNTNISLSDNEGMASMSTSLGGQLNEQFNKSGGQLSSFQNDTPVIGDSNLITPSFLGILKSLYKVPIAIYNTLSSLIVTQIFGGNSGAFSIVFGVIGSILVLSIIILVVRAIRQGE